MKKCFLFMLAIIVTTITFYSCKSITVGSIIFCGTGVSPQVTSDVLQDKKITPKTDIKVPITPN